jgi:hypothetical protein
MTSEPLPPAPEPAYLTEVLRRSGVLAGRGRVSEVVVDNSRKTILSHIVWLGLSYVGLAWTRPVRLL